MTDIARIFSRLGVALWGDAWKGEAARALGQRPVSPDLLVDLARIARMRIKKLQAAIDEADAAVQDGPTWADCHAAGMTAHEAAAAMDRHVRSAYGWATANKVKWRSERIGPPSGVPSWLQCHAAGMTVKQAARARGQGVGSAYRWARTRNVIWAGQNETLSARSFGADEKLITDERLARLAILHAKGMTDREVAAELALPLTAVLKGRRHLKLRANREPSDRTRRRNERIATITRLAAEGWTQAEIARHIGCSQPYVSEFASENNIHFPWRGKGRTDAAPGSEGGIQGAEERIEATRARSGGLSR